MALWRLRLVVYPTSRVYAGARERNANLHMEAAATAPLRVVHMRAWRYVTGH